MRERLAQIAWVVECWDDVVSDMSVFHRVEEVEAMSARRFFAFAVRLPAYSGAVTARIAATMNPQVPAAPADAAPAPAVAEQPAGRTGVRAGPHAGSSWSFATAGGDA